MLPLNGTKTHPLSDHARVKLQLIADCPIPRQSVNPGVANRLLREGLVISTMLPSPFKTHKGQKIEHLRITEKGLNTL
jgi:hypothetical protein